MTNFLSRLFGVFAHAKFPKIMQRQINKLYVKIFKINLDEFHPVESYKSLNELFTRELKHSRSFNQNPNIIISPCDALVTQSGHVHKNLALQIKGHDYKVSDLLGEQEDFLEKHRFSYINLYLSPRDYHRFHAPCDMEILQARHFGGKLLPVNEPSLKKNKNLFIQNERVVLKARAQDKLFYFVAVGALNVGKIHFNFDSNIKTNAKHPGKTHIYSNLEVKKGSEIGRFEMGSTIILIAQDILIKRSLKRVKFTQDIASFEA